MINKINENQILARGIYCVYNGNMYRYLSDTCSKDVVYLVSYNRKDLSNGFYCDKSEEYMVKNGFRCKKKVLKSAISKVYRIQTYVTYKNIKFLYDGFVDPNNYVKIVTDACWYNLKEDQRFVEHLKEIGFQSEMEERNYCRYFKFVPAFELEFFEERTELDISEL